MNIQNNKWSIVVTNTHYVKTLEKDELCCGNQDLSDAYDHLHIQWIGVDEFIRRFSHLFTEYVRYNDVPAVTAVLQSGLVAYADMHHKTDKHYYPHERLKNFLVGCFARAKIVCRFVAIDKSKGEDWSIFHEIPFSLWRFNRANLEIQELDIDQDVFVEMLYNKVVPENIKLAMMRFKHEAAIMASDLDGRH